ncbi:16S rRNA (uracil(1498)-N(3))-methyltransferase [bacterium]|nr:16S rRNA (uracil(1498)-N(3))-methyltransferase [bacterium]
MSRAPHRFYYAGQVKIDGPEVVELSPDESRHLIRVLRLKPGSAVDVFDAAGNAFSGLVEAIDGDIARVKLVSRIEPEKQLGPPVNIAVALIKRRGMDLLIEKLSELGIDSVQPLLSDRSVALPDVKPNSQPPERWERLAIAAAKQSGRNQPLNILPPETVLEWLGRTRPPAHTVFADVDQSAKQLGQWLIDRAGAPLPRWIAIGPEGGWTPRERDAFAKAGFLPVRLGGLVLRTETAAIAAASACRLVAGWNE